MRRSGWVAGIALMLAGCSAGEQADGDSADHLQYDIAEEAAADAEAYAPGIGDAGQPPADKASAPIAASGPKIAYRYALTYRLAGADIGALQRAHLALCTGLGAQRCQMTAMSTSDSEGDYARGELALKVAARDAAAFADSLDDAADKAGGSAAGRSITGEDLSKQMVDTQARITAKQALADRLLALLKDRRGSVGDLVEAERAFAEAQEELGAARSWMAEMRQRLALSDMTITYRATGPGSGGFWSPVRERLADAGAMLGSSLASLIALAVIVLPWALALAALLWVKRRRGWRWTPAWVRRRGGSAAAPDETAKTG